MDAKIKAYVTLSVVAGTSFGGGYFLAATKYTKKVEQEVAEATANAKAFYSAKAEREEAVMFKDAAEALDGYKGGLDDEDEVEQKDVVLSEEDEVDLEEVADYAKRDLDTTEQLYEPRQRLLPQKPDLKATIEKMKVTGAIATPRDNRVTKNNIFADAPRPTRAELVKPEVEEGKEGKEVANVPVVGLLQERDTSSPYLISLEEFGEGPEGYEDTEYTFYTGDGVLTNEKDQILDDAEIERIIGKNTLDHFGYLEDEPNIILVRNEGLFLQIEITMSYGKFTTEVGPIEGDNE